MANFELNNPKIAVIGLGYVGLPIALEFSKKYDVVGFDVDSDRINQLNNGVDLTGEISEAELAGAESITFTDALKKIGSCNVFIVTVPTPVGPDKLPDLAPLLAATEMIGKLLKKKDLIIYESTVYPGMTEGECAPLLETTSGLKFNKEFFVGYSPERINPGDKNRKLSNILKVVSGSQNDVAKVVADLYSQIITAGVYCAKSISVAEAAKVLENTQRDVNIALINEVTQIFEKMNLDIYDVLNAAATKWNFLSFQPGLVGGHCIGIDPYYLIHKAKILGYNPELITTSRAINERMSGYYASQFIKKLTTSGRKINNAKILILGFAFKENCRDFRNTKIVDMCNELKDYGLNVDIYDPLISADDVRNEYDLSLIASPEMNFYDGIILAVAHNEFLEMGANWINTLLAKNGIFYDLKNALGLNYE